MQVGTRFMHHSGKGPYTVINIAIRTSTLTSSVIYRQDYHHEKFPMGTLWDRDLVEFSGSVAVDGKAVPRFSRLE
jgi:hypothetical protein